MQRDQEMSTLFNYIDNSIRMHKYTSSPTYLLVEDKTSLVLVFPNAASYRYNVLICDGGAAYIGVNPPSLQVIATSMPALNEGRRT